MVESKSGAGAAVLSGIPAESLRKVVEGLAGEPVNATG
jgi:hypothetical protein